MFKSLKFKLIAVVAGAGLSSLTAVLVAIAPPAKAAPQTLDAVQSHANGDRLPLRPTGAGCSSYGWPHFEPSCQFDLRRSTNTVRPVRVLDLSRDAQLVNKKTIGLR
jgi:hypothetical protein